MELEFSKLVKIIVIRCLRAKIKRLGAQSKVYVLRTRQGIPASVKENEYLDVFFPRLMTSHQLRDASNILLQRIKLPTVVKQKQSSTGVFLKKSLCQRLFFNSLFVQNTSVAAPGQIKTKSLRLAKFQFQLFSAALDIMGSLYIATSYL